MFLSHTIQKNECESETLMPTANLICKAKIETQTQRTNIWILREKEVKTYKDKRWLLKVA